MTLGARASPHLRGGSGAAAGESQCFSDMSRYLCDMSQAF